MLFSNEPLYTGGEDFRIMRLSATYGHGEGVVGNQGIASDTIMIVHSLSSPDKLYISYDNQEKTERLAPVDTDEGVKLRKVSNPKHLATRPALSQEMLARLFHLGLLTEKFFGNHPTDMEIVIKGETIYPVQARPVNRPELMPTYLDMRKIAALKESPLVARVPGEVLVVGEASMVMVDNPEKVLLKPLLEEAERVFKKDKHQLVVVGKQEPSNSHPVVNFSGLGMPCLYIPRLKEGQDLIARIDERHFLAADVQTATLYLWDSHSQDSIENFISKGFAVHPAKISLSLPGRATVPKSTAREVPQEVKDLLLAMRSATTREVALKALKDLQNHGWISQMVQRQGEIGEKLKTTPNALAQRQLSVLTGVQEQAMRAFDESREAFAVGDRLQPLFYAKVLETALSGSTFSTGLSQYALADVESIAASTERLIAYQQKLAHPAHFSEQLVQGYEQAPSSSIAEQWQKFLLGLEPLAEEAFSGKSSTVTKQELRQFNELQKVLADTDALPGWLLFSFSGIAGRDPQLILHTLLAEAPPASQQLMRSMAQERAGLLQKGRQLDRFADPKTFDEAYKELLNTVNPFVMRQPILSGMDDFLKWVNDLLGGQPPKKIDLAGHLSSSTAVQIVTLQTMEELVTLYDGAIKSLKMSAHFSAQEKVTKVKMMLFPYLDLLEGWATQLIRAGTIPMNRRDGFNSIKDYIDLIRGFLETNIDTAASQLDPSREFNVGAATMGSSAIFSTHYPETIEDLFTLIHQNLLVFLGKLNERVLALSKDIELPKILKNTMSQIKDNEKFLRVTALGVRVTSEEIEVRFNVPMRQHSGQLILNYNKATGLISLSAFFYGIENNRWDSLEGMAKLLSEAGILPLKYSTLLPLGLNFFWKETDENSVKFAIKEYFMMGKAILSNFENYFVDAYYRLKDHGFGAQWKSYLLNRSTPFEQEMISGYIYDSLVNDLSERVGEAFTDKIKTRLWSTSTLNDDKGRLIQSFRLALSNQASDRIEFQEEIERDLPGSALIVAKLGLLSHGGRVGRVREGSLGLFEELLVRGHTEPLGELINEWSAGNEQQRNALMSLFYSWINAGHLELVENYVRVGLINNDVNKQKIAEQIIPSLVYRGFLLKEGEALARGWHNDSIRFKRKLKKDILPLCGALLERGIAPDLSQIYAIQALEEGNPQCLLSFTQLLAKEPSEEIQQLALRAAIRWSSIDDYNAILSRNLFERLVDLEFKQSYPDALAAAIKGMDSTYSGRQSALELFDRLFSKNVGLEEVQKLLPKLLYPHGGSDLEQLVQKHQRTG